MPLEIISTHITYSFRLFVHAAYVAVLILLELELDLDALGREKGFDELFLKSGVASEFHILLLYPGKEA
jgi:hypothetical protein